MDENDAAPAEYLTTRQAAKRMGVSVETVRVLCNGDMLAGAQFIGGRWRIPSSAVDDWLNGQSEVPRINNRNLASAEIATEALASGPPTRWQRFRYNPWVFYSTAVLSVLIVLAGVLFAFISAGADVGPFSQQMKEWGLVREFPPEREGETLIVIARFNYSLGTVDTKAHNEIRDAIRRTGQELGETRLRVEVSSVSIASDARNRASALGKRYDASIIIWGEDTGARVIVKFLNLRRPNSLAADVTVPKRDKLISQIASPSEYVTFVTQDLPGQLSFLSLFAIGQSHALQGSFTKSIEVIERGIEARVPESTLDEGLADAYSLLGWLYMGLDDYVQAIDRYSKALKIQPKDARIYNNRGAARVFVGDLNTAIQDFTKAIELDPQYATAYANRGNVRGEQDDLFAAIQDYDKAIELDPYNAITYTNRGNARSFKGDLNAAIGDYNKAIELDPRYAPAYVNRGNARGILGDQGAAIRDYDKAIELEPNAKFYVNRGIARWAQSDLDAAIGDFDKAIELDPQLATAYRLRGSAHDALSDQGAAVEDYTKAIDLDPQFATTYNHRGIARWKLGDLGSAIADFGHYLELAPNASDRPQVEEWIAYIENQLSNP